MILTALAKPPEARFASAHAMSVALQHATQQLPQSQWVTITGGGDARETSPQVWAPSQPASWGGSRPPPSQPPSVAPPGQTPTTVSGSSGQLAPIQAVPARSGGKGVWIGLGALLLVGGGVTAGVLATGGGAEGTGSGSAIAQQEPAPAPPTPPTPPTPPPAESDPESLDEAMEQLDDVLDEVSEDGVLTPEVRRQLEGLKKLDKLSANEKLKQLRQLQKQLPTALDQALVEDPAPGGGGAAPAAGAWPTAHELSFSYDPKHVDVAKLITFAMAQAKKEVPDAELFRIDADGVGPDGFANLELPSVASDHGSIDFRFRSASRSQRDPTLPLGVKQEWKCEFRIEANPDGVSIRPVNGSDCSKEKPVPAPRCTPAELWKTAVAKKAPTNAIASLGYRSNGRRILWYFDIGSGTDRIFSDMFADDCR